MAEPFAYDAEYSGIGEDESYVDEEKDKVLDPDRGYTDVPWLAFALVMVVGGAVLSGMALANEQVRTVHSGMDWRGQKCGSGALSDAPLRGWVNPLFRDIEAGAVCLKSCPTTSNGGQVSTWGTIMCVCNPKINADVDQPLTPLGALCNTAEGKKHGYISSNSYSSKSDISSYVTHTDSTDMLPCTFQFMTHQIMGMCVPALDAINYEQIVAQECGTAGGSACGLTENLSSYLGSSPQFGRRLIADVTHCGLLILVCCICAIVFATALFFIIQRDYGTPLMLWSNILWMAVLTGAAAYASSYFEDRANLSPPLATASSDRFSSSVLSSGAWLCGVGSVFMLGVTVHFSSQVFERSQISIQGVNFGQDDSEQVGSALTTSVTAARTLVLAGKAISLIRPMLWSVLIQVTCTLFLLMAWYFVAFSLLTSGYIWVDQYGASHLTFDHDLQWGVLFHVLFIVWLMEIIDIIVLIIGGGVIALYVFAPTTDGQESDTRIFPDFPLWHSFSTMGKFHLGTMVAAATVIMVARPLRWLTDIVHIVRFGSGVPNSRWDSMKPDPHTWCGWLEIMYHRYVLGLIRGTDKRALVQTVLHGTPFFSARSATWHLNKHYGKYMTVPLYSSSAAMFITRNNIALSCALIGHCLIMSEAFDVRVNDLQSTMMPLLVIFFFGHVIGWAFLSHLDAAVVTEMVGYAEAKLRLYTPGVPQLTVPKDLILLCEEAQVRENSSERIEETALVESAR